MAASSGRSSGLGAALRVDLGGGANASTQAHGEELSEADVWEAVEDREDTEPPSSDGSAAAASEPIPAAPRVLNRVGWEYIPGHLLSSRRNQGLSVLSTGGMTGSGQGPGGFGGLAGDIVGAGNSATSSVVIPRVANPADALRPMRRASAPVNVPDWAKVAGPSQNNEGSLLTDEDEDDEGMIPPHELVARECAKSVTFSVYEGVGRTLKGRDLSHVRTAVLRKTGFLDN